MLRNFLLTSVMALAGLGLAVPAQAQDGPLRIEITDGVIELGDQPTCSHERIVRALRKRGRGRVFFQPHDAHLAAGFQRVLRQHVAVTTVVAGSARHQQPLRLWPMFQRDAPGGLPGTRHQRERIAIQVRDTACFQRTQGTGGIQRQWAVHPAILERTSILRA